MISQALCCDLIAPDAYAAFLAGPETDGALVERLLRDPLLVLRTRPVVPAKLRLSIFKRDGNLCQLCKKGGKLHLDHFVPHVLGGPTVEENLWTLCVPCNGSKGGRPPTAHRNLLSPEFLCAPGEPGRVWLQAGETDRAAMRAGAGSIK